MGEDPTGRGAHEALAHDDGGNYECDSDDLHFADNYDATDLFQKGGRCP